MIVGSSPWNAKTTSSVPGWACACAHCLCPRLRREWAWAPAASFVQHVPTTRDRRHPEWSRTWRRRFLRRFSRTIHATSGSSLLVQGREQRQPLQQRGDLGVAGGEPLVVGQSLPGSFERLRRDDRRDGMSIKSSAGRFTTRIARPLVRPARRATRLTR